MFRIGKSEFIARPSRRWRAFDFLLQIRPPSYQISKDPDGIRDLAKADTRLQEESVWASISRTADDTR